MSSTELLKQPISNYRRPTQRRIAFYFAVAYDTTAEHAEEIPVIVRPIAESRRQVRFDPAHFKSFGDNSLDGGVVHIVPDAGSSTDMNVQQRVDVTLMREMATRSIELALPTRTAHIVPIEASLNRVSAPEPLPCRDVDTKGDAA